MNELTHLFQQDASEKKELSEDKLGNVAKLAKKQIEIQKEIAVLEKQLSEKEKELLKVSMKELPDAMMEADLAEFKTNDGHKITIDEGFAPNVTKEKKPICYAWLKDNGHGAIVKSEFKILFGKNQEEQVKATEEVLKSNNILYNLNENVHPSTLKSFVKEQMTDPEKRAKFNDQLFGVYEYKKAKIK